jgi:NitT/TauT family transport system ATP-binding protein
MPWADVRTNVRLPLDLAGVPRKTADLEVEEILGTVGLSDFASSLPKALSGGMQMRVSIARGLITKPNLLLMDEPFGALDEITRHKLDSELLGLWSSHKLTIIFVTHSIHEAVFLSSKIIMMASRPGRITQEFLINEPYPRTQAFMVSKDFLEYSQIIQASLLKAST